jgi:hypothetical protein
MVAISHRFTSAVADSSDAALVRPTNWNEEHTFLMGTGRILGRLSAGSGEVEELTPAQARDLIAAVPTTRAFTTSNGISGGGTFATDRNFQLAGQARAFHDLATNGFAVRTASGAVAARTITSSGPDIVITNGNGVAGNPVFALGATVVKAATAAGAAQTDFPIGHMVIARRDGLSSVPVRNGSWAVYLKTGDDVTYTLEASSGGAQLAGTWRSRGSTGASTSALQGFLMQRVA